ncbi:phosphate signaling complex protein PhoU [Nocardia terpenica]|uniref:phosphate signaling complex protein PhoU n=1 Tax=Nocardia terpenica TaxID=455432 RepID=UPI002FDF92EC
MRTRYHHDLGQLTGQLRAMCLRDRAAIITATRALLDADLEHAELAIDIVREINTLRTDCEHAAVTLLALQAPVAGELRQVVTTIQVVGDLTRMGTLADHIATIARRRHPACAVPPSTHPTVVRMGEAAAAMATSAAAVLASGDPDDAARLDRQDDTMDHLHQTLLASMLANDWTGGTTAVVDLTLLARFYERFADHAVEVGRRTIYMTTGETPDLHLPQPSE